MSPHVVSRWYRPPEVILLQPYTQTIDHWSVGCVVSELITCSHEYRGERYSQRQLFRGRHCSPLSPRGENQSSQSSQLNKILIFFGNLSKSDLKFIETKSSIKLSQEDKVDFEEEFFLSSPAISQMLKSLLEFNP